MKIIIEQGFMDVHFVDLQPASTHIPNNSDGYTITLIAEGQPFIVNREEQEKVEFTIVGNFELGDFLEAMKQIIELRR